MSEKVRRSWLLVPTSSEESISRAHLADADVVVLDLMEFVGEAYKPGARERVGSAIGQAGAGGAEVFAQVDPELLLADLEACVWPGLGGVVIGRLESPRQIWEAHNLLGRLEEERGILPHTLEIVASLETAQGNFQAYEVATASDRVRGLTLGRADLAMDLRPEPSGEIHLMPYLMQRLIIVANAAGATPLGAWWRAPSWGLLATPEDTYQAALRGRAAGFKGSFGIQENQVGPLNRGFTPGEAELETARRLLELYRDGSGRDGAERLILKDADSQGDRIIERGAAAQARNLIDLARACAARDEAKVAAREQRPVPVP